MPVGLLIVSLSLIEGSSLTIVNKMTNLIKTIVFKNERFEKRSF